MASFGNHGDGDVFTRDELVYNFRFLPAMRFRK